MITGSSNSQPWEFHQETETIKNYLDLKNNQIKNSVTEKIKNSSHKFNNRLDTAEEEVSEQ